MRIPFSLLNAPLAFLVNVRNEFILVDTLRVLSTPRNDGPEHDDSRIAAAAPRSLPPASRMSEALLVIFGPILKPLLLVFSPPWMWDREARQQRGVGFIFFLFLVPLLVLSSIPETYRLVTWGVLRGEIAHRKLFLQNEAIAFELIQFLLSLIVIFASAQMVKGVGETFHGRHTYKQAFATVAYALSPFFLIRLLDGIKDIPPWLTWGIGILFTMRVLYSGVPRMMQPDPAHAFGFFIMSSFLLLLTTGLAELVTSCYLLGKFPGLDPVISGLAHRLPL